MDFLSCKSELNHIRVSLSSNEMSTTLYVEELPDYTSIKQLKILSIYFHFYGDSKFDILNLYNSLPQLKEYDFDSIKSFLLKKCEVLSENDYSHTLKEVDLFLVKPKYGFKIKISGMDFYGYSAWNFFVLRTKTEFCICKDIENSLNFFKLLVRKPNFLNNISYKNLIKVLSDRDFHFKIGEL